MIDTESEPGAWEREIAMRPKTQEAGGRVMDADKLRELNDRLLISGNDYSDVLLDAALEIERLRVERDEMTRIAGKALSAEAKAMEIMAIAAKEGE